MSQRPGSGPSEPRSLAQAAAINAASETLRAVLNFACIPIYLHLMGAEAVGLVSLFATLQVAFGLLDLGLAQAASREAARHHVGGVTDEHFRGLLAAISTLFFSLATVLLVAGALLSVPLARSWFTAARLPLPELALGLFLMLSAAGARWIAGLHRGVLVGQGRTVTVAGINAVSAVVRFLGVIPFLLWVAPTPIVFFGFQAAAAHLELLAFAALVPAADRHSGNGWTSLRRVASLSGGVLAASAMWILATQADKVLLTKLIPLEEFGHVSLSMALAGGILLVAQPLAVPLIANLCQRAVNDPAGVMRTYRLGTQSVATVSFAAAATLAVSAKGILLAWTGSPVAAAVGEKPLILYSIGNAILCVAAFPYYLQFAHGNLRLHLVGQAVLLVFQLPGVWFSAKAAGAVGAAWVWVASQGVWIVAWAPVIHRRFLPGQHRLWLLHDVVTPAVTAGGVALVITLLPMPESWIGVLAGAVVTFVACVSASAVTVPAGREALRRICARLSGGPP